VSSGTTTYQAPTLGLRFRETGTATFAQSGVTSVSPGATVTVEGFDLATGRTVWTFDAGHDTSLISLSPPAQIGRESVILPGPTGIPTAVDLTTGATHPVPTATVAWCQAPTTYTVNTPYQAGNGNSISTYTGDFDTFPCNPAGHPAPTPATAPQYAGATIAGTTAWSQATEVIAAPSAA
jgi:hypothetical protein